MRPDTTRVAECRHHEDVECNGIVLLMMAACVLVVVMPLSQPSGAGDEGQEEGRDNKYRKGVQQVRQSM